MRGFEICSCRAWRTIIALLQVRGQSRFRYGDDGVIMLEIPDERYGVSSPTNRRAAIPSSLGCPPGSSRSDATVTNRL